MCTMKKVKTKSGVDALKKVKSVEKESNDIVVLILNPSN